MRWTVHGERTIYDNEWIRLGLVDVDIPGHGRIEHHVVRMPNHAVGTVVHDAGQGLLLLWRHRFITDSWGWEIPAGRIDDGETPQEAAVRETVEETGWHPGALTHLVTYHPTNGLSDQRFHVFIADGASRLGAPTDPGESERIEWVTMDRVRGIVEGGLMLDGLSLTGVLYALTFAGI
jgi:8-oxo-dGTP pyrophosphatase MutT (NUDIX family)